MVSRPLGRSQTVPAGTTFTAAGSTSAPKVACNSAPCSKMKNVPTCAKVTPKVLVTPWIKTTSVATVKPQLEQKNAGASKLPHAKKLLGENATVSFNLGINRPSAPHLPTAMPEEKMPRKGPSHKSAKKTAPTGKISKVGTCLLYIQNYLVQFVFMRFLLILIRHFCLLIYRLKPADNSVLGGKTTSVLSAVCSQVEKVQSCHQLQPLL